MWLADRNHCECLPSVMRNLAILFSIMALLSCNNSGNNNGDAIGDTVLVDEELVAGDRMIWIADYDTVKNQFYLKKQRTVNTDSLTPAKLISDINAGWENVKLVFDKVSNDTLYVTIPDSEYLTERMGSSGAQAYLASTTYNLTELRGIQFVNYDFEAGDHLSPGTFGRKDFDDFR